jgi:hypothetical protein
VTHAPNGLPIKNACKLAKAPVDLPMIGNGLELSKYTPITLPLRIPLFEDRLTVIFVVESLFRLLPMFTVKYSNVLAS